MTGASPQEDVRLGTEIRMLRCEVGDELASCGVWDVKDKSLLKGQCDLLGSRALGGGIYLMLQAGRGLRAAVQCVVWPYPCEGPDKPHTGTVFSSVSPPNR